MNPLLMQQSPMGAPAMPGLSPEEGLELPLLIQLLQDRLSQQAQPAAGLPPELMQMLGSGGAPGASLPTMGPPQPGM